MTDYFPYIPVIQPPSGFVAASGSMIPSGIYLFAVYPDLCSELLIISGIGFPRVFQGSTGTYLFNTPRGVLFSESEDVWTTISNSASSITQIEGSTLGAITVLFRNISGNKTEVYAQRVPETTSGWSLQTTISGCQVADSAGDPDGLVSSKLPVLAGNNLNNTYSRITRNTVRDIPIGDFADSDSGIPQITPEIAQITDLEAV